MQPGGNAPWPGPQWGGRIGGLAHAAAAATAAPVTALQVKAHDHVWARIRRDAEEASFFANVLLLLVATVALVAAYRQATQARKARSFEAFDSLQAKWDRPAIQAARAGLFLSYDGLEHAEKARSGTASADPPAVRTAMDHALRALRQDQPQAYGAYWALMELIEEIGLLCRSDYLDVADIKNSIGTGLYSCIEMLMPHIEWRRREVDGLPSMWANTIWLFEKMPRVKSWAVRGYGL